MRKIRTLDPAVHLLMTAPVLIDSVSHYFGTGDMRKRVLDSVSCEIRGGEIVILTGPSGSGKTTLLTLIGAVAFRPRGQCPRAWKRTPRR